MIYLFDNCYLSTANQVQPDCKHVWVGDFSISDDILHKYAFDVYKIYEDMGRDELDELCEDIHANLATTKIIIYADVKNFQMIYATYFGSILPASALLEMYRIDAEKENLGLGGLVYGHYVRTNQSGNKTTLPLTLTYDHSLILLFARRYQGQRVELALVSYILGVDGAKEYCVNLISKIWNGIPGFHLKFVEQTLPAYLTNDEYTTENVLSRTFIDGYLNYFAEEEIISDEMVEKIEDIFDFNYLEHFFNVMNGNNLTKQEYLAYWNTISSNKDQFIEDVILNLDNPIKAELLFPNITNFNSVNPILWTLILHNKANTSWLEKFKVTNGINN
jgi:hypothetical protein